MFYSLVAISTDFDNFTCYLNPIIILYKAGFPLVTSARRTTEEKVAGRQIAAPLRHFKGQSARGSKAGFIPPSLSCLGVGLWYDFYPIPDASTLIRHWFLLNNCGIYEGLSLIRHHSLLIKNFSKLFLNT